MQPVEPVDPLALEASRIRDVYSKITRRYVWSSLSYEFENQERERETLALLRRYDCMPLSEKSILDVGCGSGSWMQLFIRWGARPDRVTGVDVRRDALQLARNAVPNTVRLGETNAAALPFVPARFDIVLQSTMFTSILDRSIRRQIASEMLRVLKPDGVIIWYDFLVDNPSNPNVSRVSKREIVSLFPGCSVDLKRVTLVAPVLRWIAPRSWFLTYLLSQFPPFCTHYLGAIRRRDV